jgi:hypothetical protein
MKSGLLWYDASVNTIEKKIAEASKRYKEKFGVEPNTCFVNPVDLKTKPDVTRIKVLAKPTILPNHLWLGISES